LSFFNFPPTRFSPNPFLKPAKTIYGWEQWELYASQLTLPPRIYCLNFSQYIITNFGQGLYLADDSWAKLCTTVNGKLNAARERQTKSPTSTTGTDTTSRSIKTTSKHTACKNQDASKKGTSSKKLQKNSAFTTGKIREEDVKLSGKGIYSRKKQYRNQRNNNTRNR
jgi:hypothetical protein